MGVSLLIAATSYIAAYRFHATGKTALDKILAETTCK
jgi:hypothetical protein